MGIEVNIIKKLKGFELKVGFKTEDQTLGFLGESGAGKSMTLRCISGIDVPDSGRIILNNRVLFDSDKKINIPVRNRKIGFLFQNYTLFPNMTVEQNIGFALSSSISKADRKELIQNQIETMHLNGLEKRYPCELSGGQQQRVALARALAVNPEILLLDEPFSSLDENLKSHMVSQLKEDISQFRGTTILVTHNREEAYQLCREIIILSKGRVDSSGNKEEMFNNPPTFSAGKITGCKNISRVRKINDNTLEASDWGSIITTNSKIENNIKYIGIRAHYLELEECTTNNINVFDCYIVSVSENLFRVIIYLKFKQPPQDKKDYHVIWDISKEEWNIVKNKPLPLKIRINPDKIILMKDSL